MNELKTLAADITNATGVSVMVLPCAVLEKYEIVARGRSYGPFNATATRVWLQGIWAGIIAAQDERESGQ